MNWLTAWKNKKLEIAWEYTTNGILWRLLPSRNGFIVLEDRDVDAKSVSFTCLDVATGAIRWSGKQFDERWWVSIEAIHEQVVILHEYATPDMPDHKKITVVDLRNGHALWSNDEMRFLFANAESMYVMKDEYDNRRFFEVDALSGNVIREVDDQYLNVLRDTVAVNRFEHIEFPMAFNGDTVSASLRESVAIVTEKVENIGLIEYVEKGEFLVVSYYELAGNVPTQQLFRQHLIILHREQNKIVHRDMLAVDAAMNVPDTFFGLGAAMMYIKNKKTLRSINLLPDPGASGKN